MEKKEYLQPDLSVCELTTQDVITISRPHWHPDPGGGGGGETPIF